MCDVQEEIGVKNMSDIVRKVIWGIFRTKIQQKIIKNCTGKKKTKKKKKKILGVNQGLNYMIE